MATPPTFVTDVESAFDTTTSPKTANVGTRAAGDLVVVSGGAADGGTTLATPTGGSLTYTAAGNVGASASGCRVAQWTAPVAGSVALTTSLTNGGTVLRFGQNTSVFSSHGGVGTNASVQATANANNPSLGIACSDNSALIVIATDWNAIDLSTAQWRQINAVSPTVLASGVAAGWYSWAVLYYADVGLAATKQVGINGTPTGIRLTLAAVEIKGTTAGTTQVSTTRRVNYAVQAQVAATRRVTYNVLANVAATRRVAYSVQAAVSATRRVRYDVLAAVAATRRIGYIVGTTQVAATRRITYSVQAQVAQTKRVVYGVLAQVAATRTIAYGVNQAVVATRRVNYSVQANVTGQRRLTYVVGLAPTVSYIRVGAQEGVLTPLLPTVTVYH